jgi:hypothetical protein
MDALRSPGPLLAVGLLVAVTLTVGLYELLVADLALAGATGVCWGGGVALTLRHLGRPETRGRWRVARWSGAFGGAVTLAAVTGVSPGLPIAASTRFALSLLVLGTGLLTFNLGTAMVLDATGGSESAGDTA